jgi:hypothetical protein
MMVTFSLACLCATAVGWHMMAKSPDISSKREPGGDGWFLVAEAPVSRISVAKPDAPVALWWNPTQTIIGGVAALLTGFVLLTLVRSSVRRGVEWAHLPAYRGEQRMSAALDYAAAWWLAGAAGFLIICLRPLSLFGAVAGWSWMVPEFSFELAGSVVIGFALVLWWFWLLRLGVTATFRTRSRVVTFMALGPALLSVGGFAGWWYLLHYGLGFIFERMNLAA